MAKNSKSPEPKEFKFRIRQMSERSFFLNIPHINESPEIDYSHLLVSLDFDFHCSDLESNLLTISTIASYSYSHKNNKVKLLESSTINQFEINDMKELLECNNNDQVFKDKANIIPILLNISISTLRGIIIARTAGTPMAAFPLPVVDVKKIIQKKKKQE